MKCFWKFKIWNWLGIESIEYGYGNSLDEALSSLEKELEYPVMKYECLGPCLRGKDYEEAMRYIYGEKENPDDIIFSHGRLA